MKKVLIVLLAALLLVSFSSCEKDKSEDVIAAYESFCKVQKIVKDVPPIFDDMDAQKDAPAEKSNADISIDGFDLDDLLEDIDSKYEKIYTLKDLSATGTVKRELSEEGTTSTETWTVTNCEVSFKYDLKDNREAFIDDKITINGTFIVKTLGTRGTIEPEEVDANFSLNGTNYSISYATNAKQEFTRAKVNGNDVDLRLLNSSL